MKISNEVIGFIAASLLEIIESEELEKDEIISTLKLWKKTGWGDSDGKGAEME